MPARSASGHAVSSSALTTTHKVANDQRKTTVADRTTCRILLADDDAHSRRMVSRSLRRHGFDVVEADNGAAALELADEDPPDLAIIDLRMPHVDGFEVVSALKKEHAHALPVLVLSGMDDPEDRVRAFDVGADDFIAKPVHPPELMRRVDAFERTRRAYLAAQEANRRADRLRLFAAEAAALLAHDLNNGLSVALANLQFVEEVCNPKGEARDAFGATTRALRRMSGLVRNFVDVSRLEDAALTPSKITFQVPDLLRTAAEVHDPGAAQSGIRVGVDCPPALLAELDPVLMERVIHNLLGNAVRYVSSEGRICLRAYENPEREHELVLEVSNTGDQIPEAQRDKLFDKYVRGRDGKARRGMGLYFCRLAVEAHGGTIGLASVTDFDTTFRIRLPGALSTR